LTNCRADVSARHFAHFNGVTLVFWTISTHGVLPYSMVILCYTENCIYTLFNSFSFSVNSPAHCG